MKFKMAKNSLFAILLRSPWWISVLIGTLLGLVGAALLGDELRVVGALAGFPFLVIGALAARSQWHLPNASRVAQTQQAVSAMAWPAFQSLLEQAFRRDGYEVQRGKSPAVDFELERGGRRMLVSARRWKSARTGLEVLRALQDAREAGEATDALYIGLGEVSENARDYAIAQGIKLWGVAELAVALRQLPLAAPTVR